jgi:hypothetical protein
LTEHPVSSFVPLLVQQTGTVLQFISTMNAIEMISMIRGPQLAAHGSPKPEERKFDAESEATNERAFG